MLLAFGLGAPKARAAADARYEGVSADGSIAFFSTTDRIVSGDTDNRKDIFERSKNTSVGEYVTRQVSLGPIGGNAAYDVQYIGASAAGTTVFFATNEPLTPDDEDEVQDVYVRNLDANTTTRVSQGEASCAPGCGNGNTPTSFVAGGVVPDGTKLFFVSGEKLSPLDGDSSPDIYMRDLAANTTTLVSQGDADCKAEGCGNGSLVAFFRGSSENGDKVFLTSSEGLVKADEDGATDIYVRDLVAETTRLVSVAATCPAELPAGQTCDPSYGGASNDGSHVFFETNERLSGSDVDKSQDVYDWSEGVIALASIGPNGGNGEANVTYAGNSASGGAVFFQTSERLDTSADTDAVQDVYKRSGGATTLVSAGDPSCAPSCGNGGEPASLSWVSPDDSTSAVFLVTDESLTGADTDTAQDVYERDGSETKLISQGDSLCAEAGCGNGPLDANFSRASDNGSHAFFVTDESLIAPDPEEPLLAADSDESADIYERFNGATRLISIGEINGNGPFDARLHGISQNGSRAFFVTEERLTSDDDFGQDDVYARLPTGTLLISVGNNPELEISPPPPVLQGTNPASPNASTEPAIVGQAEAGAAIKVYDSANCEEGEPVATGTAAELASPGITVTVAAGSTNSFWATAEVDGLVSPCSNAITYKQEAPPPPPPPSPPGSGGGSGGGGSTSTGTGTTSGSDSAATSPKTSNGGIAFVTPETRITFGPSFKTKKRKVVFRFFDATGQPGTNFFCKLDRHRWRSCGSPQRLRRLSRGRHVFDVKAVNAVGVWQPRPTKRRFKVVAG